MSRLRDLTAVVLAAFALVPAAQAMGGQDCAPEDLAPVDAWLAKHPFLVGATGPDSLVAAACKPSPSDKSNTIVAAACDPLPPLQPDSDKALVVALVDTRSGHVRSSFKGVIHEDAVMRLTQGGLSLDTARYQLAPGMRAFGVDVASGASGPRCADGGLGPWRALFVQDGAALRMLLDGFVLQWWRFVNVSPCGRPEDQDDDIDTTSATLAVGSHATNGLADLVVTESVATKGKRVRDVLTYDGTTYRNDTHPTDSVIDFEASAPTPAAR